MTNFITIFASIVAAQIFASMLYIGLMFNDWVRSKVTKMVMKMVENFEDGIENQEKIES